MCKYSVFLILCTDISYNAFKSLYIYTSIFFFLIFNTLLFFEIKSPEYNNNCTIINTKLYFILLYLMCNKNGRRQHNFRYSVLLLRNCPLLFINIPAYYHLVYNFVIFFIYITNDFFFI